MKKVLTWIVAAIVGVILGFVILWITSTPVEAAQSHSEVVSFNDAEQLAALSDSIVGVKDTVRADSVLVIIDSCYFNQNMTKIIQMRQGRRTEPGEILDITCRELVNIVADWPTKQTYYSPEDEDRKKGRWQPGSAYLAIYDMSYPKTEITPGTAIITWREVKR